MRESIVWKIYTILFAIGILVPALHTASLIAVIVLNVLVLLSGSKAKTMVLMSSFMMNEIFCIINVIAYFLLNSRKPTIKIKKLKLAQFILIAVVLSNSMICAMINDTWPNILFTLLYYLLLWLTWQVSKDSADEENIIPIIKDFLHIQFILQILIGIVNRNFDPGDIFTGSIGNAHFIALWCLIQTVSLFTLDYYCNKRHFLANIKYNLLSYIESAVIIYLASAKAIFIAAILSLIAYWIIHVVIKSKHEIFILIIGTYILFALAILALNIPAIKNSLSQNYYAYLYIYKPGWNVKFSYFKGTMFDSLKGIRSLIGYGIGQYGSRFANAFAYTQMYRNSNAINNFISTYFKPHFVPEFARYISVYSADFVQGITWRSAILSYPFSSFIALLAEFGIIGVVLFANFLQKTVQDSKCIALVYVFFYACIFDIYFDNFQCVGAALTILAITVNSQSKERQFYYSKQLKQ